MIKKHLLKELTPCSGLNKQKNVYKKKYLCEAIAKDLTQQLLKDTADGEFFSLQLDESADVSDTAQLCIFI